MAAAVAAGGDISAASPMLPPPNLVISKGLKPLPEGEDLADEPSEPAANLGMHRYENMLKSMIARLEVNNSLAPIQDYGRH